MNILGMGGRTFGPAVAWDLVQTFLAAEFSQAQRRSTSALFDSVSAKSESRSAFHYEQQQNHEYSTDG